MTRKSVLIIAEAANPEWVSVPLVGWSMYRAISEVADVHLVSQIRNREALLRAGLVEGRDFTAIDSEAVARPMWRLANVLRMDQGKGWTMATAINAITYPYFERLVWKQFGPQLREGRFDLVHRITPLSPTANSSLAARTAALGIPFVLGPLNGGVPWPRGFDSERRREREWLSYVRSAYKLSPGRRRMLRSTRAIIVGSRHTGSEIPAQHQRKCVYIPENAIDVARFNLRSPQTLDGPLKACFIGRLVPYKGPDMLLEAAAPFLRTGQLILDIIGDGPLKADLEALAVREGLTENVTFHGQIPHEKVQDIAAQTNILTFPSIREFGGGVVLEAMALGVVPVVVDYAGPGELVTEKTGYKIPLGSRAEIVARLGQTLATILSAPEALREKSIAAEERVRELFTWEAKAQQIDRVYDWALGRSPDRLDVF